MATLRKTGLDVSVFNVGGNFLDDLENATLTVNVESEDAKALKDAWSYAWATGKAWTLEADIFVAASAALVTDAATGDALVSVSFTSGGNAYSGTGLIKTASHTTGKGQLQRQRVTIEGQGALGIA